jgi:hypothetical protein
MWRNTWKPGQEGITFEYRANIARGCTEGWGVGLLDVGPRFADLDGDGRGKSFVLVVLVPFWLILS